MGDLLWIGVLALAWVVLKYRPAWIYQLIVSVAGGTIGRLAVASQPDSISLVPAEGAAGLPAARGAIESLTKRGFAPAGSFRIPEMKDLPVHFLLHTAQPAIAVVYEHPQAGVWTDIVCRYQDGRRFTINNSKVGGGLDQQPGHTTLRKPGLSTTALCMSFERERPAGSLVPVVASEIPLIFADAYADEIAWRKNRGVSKAEVRNVAREMDQPVESDATAA